MIRRAEPWTVDDEDDIVVDRDLVYATVDGAELRLDAYRCAGPGAPVVVYAHGGGWIRGDKVEDGTKRLVPSRRTA
jgi:acetyl esterase/lipase